MQGITIARTYKDRIMASLIAANSLVVYYIIKNPCPAPSFLLPYSPYLFSALAVPFQPHHGMGSLRDQTYIAGDFRRGRDGRRLAIKARLVSKTNRCTVRDKLQQER